MRRVVIIVKNLDKMAKFFKSKMKRSTQWAVLVVVAMFLGDFVRDSLDCSLGYTILEFVLCGVDTLLSFDC